MSPIEFISATRRKEFLDSLSASMNVSSFTLVLMYLYLDIYKGYSWGIIWAGLGILFNVLRQIYTYKYKQEGNYNISFRNFFALITVLSGINFAALIISMIMTQEIVVQAIGLTYLAGMGSAAVSLYASYVKLGYLFILISGLPPLASIFIFTKGEFQVLGGFLLVYFVGVLSNLRRYNKLIETSFENLLKVFKNYEDLSNLITQLPFSVAMFDKDYNYLAYSTQWKTDHNISSDLINQSHEKLFPESASFWSQIVEKVYNDKVTIQSKGDQVTYNGKELYLSWSVVPWFDEEEVKGVVIIYDDLTEIENTHKKLEEQKVFAFNQQRLATIGQLAAGVGHEINNPLVIILGYLRKLESNIEKPENVDIVNKIKIASNRIANIVNGMRLFARKEDNKLTVFDLKDAVDESIILVKDIYSHEGIDISFSRDEKDFLIEADKGRIHQVVMNLISNAKDATKELAERKIELKLENVEKRIILTVSDNGHGIDDETMKKIYDPFFTTKEMSLGTGIGLSLTKKIIKEHNGEIKVESKVDQGTKFSLIFPEAKDASEMKSNEIVELKNESNQLSLLLIDDEEDILIILEDILKAEGIEVQKTACVQTALKLVSENEFDGVISDYNLPKTTGVEIFSQIQNELNRHPKCMLITGRIDELEFPANVKVDGQIPKPFNRETIVKTLNQVFKLSA